MGRPAHLLLREGPPSLTWSEALPTIGRLRRRVAVLLALSVVAAPTATASGKLVPSALQRELAKALRVPHVSAARSAAVAVDLTTGSVLYTQNAARPLKEPPFYPAGAVGHSRS